MPLNEIAQTKLIEWLNGLHKSAEEELLEKFGERGRNLIAMAQIFTEDEEWARELMSSGILINYLGFIYTLVLVL